MRWVGPDARTLPGRSARPRRHPHSFHDRQGEAPPAVEELSELEAEQTLAFIASRREPDPVLAFFENAPEDDEPLTPEEQASVDEAWAQRGDSVSRDELRREFD